MRLIGYTRTSVRKDEDDSHPAQEAALRAWAIEQGHVIVGIERDEGRSGQLPPAQRPGLSAALDLVREHQVGGLLIRRLDRLARELTIQEGVLASVWANGGRAFEASGGEVLQDDPHDPMRKAMRQMAGVFYELERGMIVQRLQAGRRRKMARYDGLGSAGGKAKLGHDLVGERKDARLIPRDDYPALRERVATLRQGRTLRQVAQALNDLDVPVPSANGGRWHPITVSRVLAS